jgi:hypothetical protein
MLDSREKEIFEWFFSFVGYFNHYSFFTNKLWKNVKGFENHDEAEIKCMFMHYWTLHKFYIYSCPVGVGWFSLVNENSYNKYIQEYQPVIDAFEEWKIRQR